MQRGLISSCNFITDWSIVMGKISIVGLALATSKLATTDFRSVHINLDWTSKCSFGKKSVIPGSY